MDKVTDGTDVDGRASEWLTLAEASRVLRRTERTIRRYVKGEIQPPAGVEFSTSGGRILVRVTDAGRTEDGRGRAGVLPAGGRVLADLEATRQLLQERELAIARLESQLAGKAELLQAKEAQIGQLLDTQAHQQTSIEHMEILLGNLQKALPAPKKAATGEPRPPGRIEALPWKWFLLIILALICVALGVWYVALFKPFPLKIWL